MAEQDKSKFDEHLCEEADSQMEGRTKFLWLTFAIDAEGSVAVACHYHGAELQGLPEDAGVVGKLLSEIMGLAIPDVVRQAQQAASVVSLLRETLKKSTEEKPSDSNSESNRSTKTSDIATSGGLKDHGVQIH